MASGQADIVAHSMGGDITVTLLSLPAYKQSQSYGIGSVSTVITIGTPYTGAPLANALLDPQNSCPAYWLGLGGNWSISNAIVAGSTVNGGVFDLQQGVSGSGNLGLPTLAIASTVDISTQTNLNTCSFCLFAKLKEHCPATSPLIQNMWSPQWQTIAGGAGDGIVPYVSQINIANTASLTGLLHSAGLRILGFTGTAELEDTNGVPNSILNFRNTPQGVASPALSGHR